MKLLSISINNFRGIKGDKTIISFEGSDIIFLLGQNNVGKSTILTAYEYLITPKQKSTISDFYSYSEENHIEIEAIFKKEIVDEVVFKKKGFDKWVDLNNGIIKFRKKWIKAGEEGKKETWDPIEKNMLKMDSVDWKHI